ncbi:MAG: aminoacyl-tRNA hydrolase [Nitrospira sp.]|nr:MAG: aminoacyl-tRNA hydrolase [Nitrospira sp. OLB3]MCE7966024.1 aminoacyl-tRNA hydrolase [Nitrospira sp. NTP2]MCK6493236.1 aminoacyl-tRNA hydrolase [Nitrospira sp.]MEB2339022.1 aminoacyl-tRNA hydrolase [Nitrospirales bacterium]MCK6498791.1 aminoacyl-tRNA hydrolase [Nitrospira sp.]
MHLIVGLGNPGPQYAATRHNIGCWVVERAAARWSIRLIRKGAAQRGSGRAGSKLVELAGMLDWMNVTGPPLKGLLRELGLTPEALVVVHDDLDMEPGRLRIRQGGGSGGHNGIKSIVEALGTPQFVRVKIGIGRPAPRQDSADYVLEPVSANEMAVYEPCLARAVDALELLVNRDVATAMNQFNVRDKPEGGPKPNEPCQ